MSKNKTVQTGPKTHEGGLNDGLTRVWYQVLTEGMVKILPTMPAPSVIKIQKISLTRLNFGFDFLAINKVYTI